MEVKALPEFVKLFKNTNVISCMLESKFIFCYLGEKGKSHMLIRNTKKRSKEEFEKGQLEIHKDMWNEEREKMIFQIEKLKQKVTDLENMEEAYLIDSEKLHNLFEKGIIDESGMPTTQNNMTDMV